MKTSGIILCTFVMFSTSFVSGSPLIGKRNSRESVIVYNNGTEISKDNIVFALELKYRREEISFHEALRIPRSSRKYRSSILKTIHKHVEMISATIEQVGENKDRVKIASLSPEEGWKDGNVVFFIPTKERYRIVYSLKEIERLVHPHAYIEFDENTLAKVDTLLSEAVF